MQIAWHPSDDELSSFMDAYLDSFCVWDILMFLAHNPEALETPGGLGARIGRPGDEVQQCLDRLRSKGLVQVATAFDENVYRLVPESGDLAVLRRFAAQQSEPAVRAEALRRIMDARERADRGLRSGERDV